MNQILNIYKPKGWTSHDVVAKIRKDLQVKKVGHAGTLDPMAEGVLIVLLGDTTKKQSEFMKLPKTYVGDFAFGFETDTFDLEGQITASNFETKVVLPDLESALPQFIGKIKQQVPAYSAVKVAGQKMYELARKGTAPLATLPIKEIEIYSINILSFQMLEIKEIGKTLPVARLEITCGSGTYIRSLARDLGHVLHTHATLVRLVRTKIGEFTVENAQKL